MLALALVAVAFIVYMLATSDSVKRNAQAVGTVALGVAAAVATIRATADDTARPAVRGGDAFGDGDDNSGDATTGGFSILDNTASSYGQYYSDPTVGSGADDLYEGGYAHGGDDYYGGARTPALFMSKEWYDMAEKGAKTADIRVNQAFFKNLKERGTEIEIEEYTPAAAGEPRQRGRSFRAKVEHFQEFSAKTPKSGAPEAAMLELVKDALEGKSEKLSAKVDVKVAEVAPGLSAGAAAEKLCKSWTASAKAIESFRANPSLVLIKFKKV